MDRKTFELFCNFLPPEIVEEIEAYLDALYRYEAVKLRNDSIVKYWRKRNREREQKRGHITGGGVFALIASDSAQDIYLTPPSYIYQMIIADGLADQILFARSLLEKRKITETISNDNIMEAIKMGEKIEKAKIESRKRYEREAQWMHKHSKSSRRFYR